jgi:hypothetical protein
MESGVELHPQIKSEWAYLMEQDQQRGLMESTEDHKNKKFDQMIGRKRVHLLPLQMEGEIPRPWNPQLSFINTRWCIIEDAEGFCLLLVQRLIPNNMLVMCPKIVSFISLVTPRV